MKRVFVLLFTVFTFSVLFNSCIKDYPKDMTEVLYTAEIIDHDKADLSTELREICEIYYKQLNVAGSPFVYFGPVEQCDIRAVNCCNGAEKYVDRYIFDHEDLTEAFTFVLFNKHTNKELYRYTWSPEQRR